MSGWGSLARDGGSAGSDGISLNASNVGGTGQGTAYWAAAFAAFNQSIVNITAGAGGVAQNFTGTTKAGGGGGGGGIVVNGMAVKAGTGAATGTGGGGGVGYGAGGGGGGCYNTTCIYNGGFGAPGVCVIAWN